MLRIIPLFFLFLTACGTLTDKREYGYILVDIYSVDDASRMDYWVGIWRGQRGAHLYTKTPIHKVVAAEYEISHFDRVPNFSATHDDLEFEEKTDAPRFHVIVDTINYLGIIVLERTEVRGAYRLDVKAGGGLMQRACAQDPEIFQKMNVRFALFELKAFSEFKYDCETNTAHAVRHEDPDGGVNRHQNDFMSVTYDSLISVLKVR